ncbi:hypothetical protein ACFRCG_35105 [Embleya sp. NPDC056575]
MVVVEDGASAERRPAERLGAEEVATTREVLSRVVATTSDSTRPFRSV